MFITIEDEEGNVYTNDNSKNNDKTIIEIHFSTSGIEAIVEDISKNPSIKTICI